MYPATSCKEIHDCDPTAPSGYYWVNTSTGVRQVLCSTGVSWVAMLRQAFTYCTLLSTTAHDSNLRTRLIHTVSLTDTMTMYIPGQEHPCPMHHLEIKSYYQNEEYLTSSYEHWKLHTKFRRTKSRLVKSDKYVH